MFVPATKVGEAVGLVLKAAPMGPVLDEAGVPQMGFNILRGVLQSADEAGFVLRMEDRDWHFRQDDILAWTSLQDQTLVTAPRRGGLQLV